MYSYSRLLSSHQTALTLQKVLKRSYDSRMASFQFRKRFKVANGLSLNISKKGAGYSLGPKGLKLSRSAQGNLSGSAGIPGSGLSYRGRLDSTGASQRSESEEISMTPSILENAEYISIHGQILHSDEMRKAFIFLALLLICLVTFIFTAFTTPLGFLLNPFPYAYLVFSVLYVRESNKNKKLIQTRKIKHMEKCEHLLSHQDAIEENSIEDSLTQINDPYRKGLIDKDEYKLTKAKILGIK